MGGLMSLQGAHRTSGVTIHLVLLPSQQRTHQDMNTQAGFHVTVRTDAAPLGRPATFQLTLPFRPTVRKSGRLHTCLAQTWLGRAPPGETEEGLRLGAWLDSLQRFATGHTS